MIRKFQLLLVLIILAAVALGAGCGRSALMKLSTSDNGKTITIKNGDVISVELEGNPSTGYNWEPKDLDSAMLQQVGEPAFSSSNPGLIGSSGTVTLTFKALKTGTTALNLIYHRPWETDVKPTSTYSVTIVSK